MLFNQSSDLTTELSKKFKSFLLRYNLHSKIHYVYGLMGFDKHSLATTITTVMMVPLPHKVVFCVAL